MVFFTCSDWLLKLSVVLLFTSRQICGFSTRVLVFTLESRIPNPDYGNWFEKSGFRKLEGGMKSYLIYEVLFYNNQESNRGCHDTLVQFFSFHLNGHSLNFYLRLEG